MPEEELTNNIAMADFRTAYSAKKKLIDEQKDDVLFALGKQWKDSDVAELRDKGVKAITDNRIRPNLNLLTGLERQNRTDYKAFPEGKEDSLDARIATALFKKAMKRSDGSYKFSEMFEDGTTCGESYLELYLDRTYSLVNPRPRIRKYNFDDIYPEPGWKEYDLSDISYVYKLTRGLVKGEIISVYPEAEKVLKNVTSGVLSIDGFLSDGGVHEQGRDYPQETSGSISDDMHKKNVFDLIERYYKKWIDRVFVLDTIDGDVIEVEEEEESLSEPASRKEPDPIADAKRFIKKIVGTDPKQQGRFRIIKRTVPEIWVYAMVGGTDKPISDKRAWFYPKWKSWPFVPYFAHWTSLPLNRGDAHLAIQGIVRGTKDSQIEHNKRKTQFLRHIDSSANSGWLVEEDTWVDRDEVKRFGSSPGANLEYRKGRPKPERITPFPLPQAHVFASQDSVDSIKQETGINADLLASQDGGQASGRAIALRQRQGVVNVQKFYDNESRTKRIFGLFILSQFSEMFDRKSVKKIIGESFIKSNFSRQEVDPETGQSVDVFDQQSEDELNQTIDRILNDINLGNYDIAVGESVMSETMRLAQENEIKEFIVQFPGIVTPEIVIEESSLPPDVKTKILSSIQKNAQQAALAQAQVQAPAGQPNTPTLITETASTLGARR